MRTLLSLIVSAILASPASAGYPDDVNLSAMSEWRGSTVVNPTAVGSAYDIVIRQLGASIMNAPIAPAETLGLNGFDLSVGSTFAFLSARGETINRPAPWERVHQDEDPTHVLWRPGVTVRKGLPLSLEVGANWSWVGFSRQTALGGFGRWSILEGWKKAPDLTLQMGYTGYVGNDELELGALDGRLTIGHTFPIGYLIGINHADVVPFAGIGFLKINAAPRLSAQEQADLGIGAVSGMKSKDSYTEGFSLFTTHLGMRIRSGDFHITTSGAIVAKALPTVNVSVGLTY
jgi:hypothetical protein